MQVSDSSERRVDLFGELSKEQLVARRGTDLLQQIVTWPQKTTHTRGFVWVDLVKSSPQGCDQKFAAQLFLASSCYMYSICAVLISILIENHSLLHLFFLLLSFPMQNQPPSAGRFWPPGTARWAPMPCSWPRSAWSAWTTGWRSASCGAARRGKSRERRHGRGRWRRRCRCGSWCRQRNEGWGLGIFDDFCGDPILKCWECDPVALGNSSGLWLLDVTRMFLYCLVGLRNDSVKLRHYAWATILFTTHRIWKLIFWNCRNLGDSQLGGVGIRWGGAITSWSWSFIYLRSLFMVRWPVSIQYHLRSFTMQLASFKIQHSSCTMVVSKCNWHVSKHNIDRTKSYETPYLIYFGRYIYQLCCEQKGAKVWTLLPGCEEQAE